MAMPEAWRKTGRKATDAHWIGLCAGEVTELVVYDDHGQQQGTIVVELVRCEKSEGIEGETWTTRVRAVQDEYFSWWMSETYVDGMVTVHFCGRRSDQCQVQTPYRHPLHADVFRLLPGDSALRLSWLTVEQKQAITQWLKSSGLPEAGPGQVPDPGGGGPGATAAVETGEPGIRGLAAALGSGGAQKTGAGDPPEGTAGHGLKRKKKEEEDDGSYGKGLQQKVAARSPPVLGPSALRMTLGKKKKKSSESESSDRSDSLFRLAALPAGHREDPQAARGAARSISQPHPPEVPRDLGKDGRTEQGNGRQGGRVTTTRGSGVPQPDTADTDPGGSRRSEKCQSSEPWQRSSTGSARTMR